MLQHFGIMMADFARESATTPATRATYSGIATLLSASIALEGVKGTVKVGKILAGDLREAREELRPTEKKKDAPKTAKSKAA